LKVILYQAKTYPQLKFVLSHIQFYNPDHHNQWIEKGVME